MRRRTVRGLARNGSAEERAASPDFRAHVITAERTLDTSWAPDLLSWTEGRQVMNFRYLRDGKAIGAVLHHEKFGGGFDLQGELSDQEAFWEAYGLHYRLWMFDLSAGTAEPVRGLPDEDLPPSYSHAEINGRFFLMRETSDFRAPWSTSWAWTAKRRSASRCPVRRISGLALQTLVLGAIDARHAAFSDAGPDPVPSEARPFRQQVVGVRAPGGAIQNVGAGFVMSFKGSTSREPENLLRALPSCHPALRVPPTFTRSK